MKRKKLQVDASLLLLALIGLILAAGIGGAFLALGSNPVEDSVAQDRILNTLFVIEREGKPLCAYAVFYYPGTRRASAFDIPGNLGLILQRIKRVDRIDTVYDPRNITAYEDEVELLLSIEFAFTLVITLEDLGKLVDLIEGVEIFIPAPVAVFLETAGDDAAQGATQSVTPVFFPSGLTRLDGDKALTYITYELPDEASDAAAFRRQRFFIGLIKRLGEKNEDLKKPQVAGIFQGLFKTGMNQTSRTRLFDEFARIDTDKMGMQSVGGNNREVSGQTLVFPYWDGSLIKDIVLQSLGSLVRPVEGIISDRVYTVEVLNGTNVNGLAGRTAELLRGFGYDVISIGNADRSDYEKTFIQDRSGGGEAVETFAEIIRCTDIQEEDPEPVEVDVQNFEYRADFTLVIGKDFNDRYVTGN